MSDTPESTITPDEVLAKLREAASADPFAADRKSAAIRQAGVGLSEAIGRSNAAVAHVATCDGIVLDLATKAMAVLADIAKPATQTPDAPKRRGRPPGSSNKTATSDSPAANGGSEPLAD